MKQGLWAAYSFLGDLPSARLSLCTQGEKRFTRAWHSCHSRFLPSPSPAPHGLPINPRSAITCRIPCTRSTASATPLAARASARPECDFLIAVPVKSFNSGDTNRDLHMIEATRGAQFPMIVVRARFPQSEITQQWIHADLEVQFAGQTAHYSSVPFERSEQGSEVRITGTIPLTCSDFKIDRPSFLGIAIKNEIPVRIDMSWHSQ